jgi:hypothetical protein
MLAPSETLPELTAEPQESNAAEKQQRVASEHTCRE